MKPRDLRHLGVPDKHIKLAGACATAARQSGMAAGALGPALKDLLAAPGEFATHPQLGPLAHALARDNEPPPKWQPRAFPAPWKQFGEDLDPQSVRQLEHAAELPVAVRGALMPDAHVGYGLPIGGVLATENAVIPYAVGVDIACRMKLTVLDLAPEALERERPRLIRAIEEETRFGVGAAFRGRDLREHAVVDDPQWSHHPLLRGLREKAMGQLGTSGSGNHFVEFGTLVLDAPDLGLEAGTYLALLSHSGSRGAGAAVAAHYSRLARDLHPELPKELGHLAWLDLDTDAGQAYWEAMELMGRYAAANHAVIHRAIARHLGARVRADIENHHNFAWKEIHDGREVVVHRKGATPAAKGLLGVIPGSMATPGFVVRGRGNADSLASAAHGAGRVMSRKQARQTVNWSQVRKRLSEADITLLSADVDEAPEVYKDIEAVMRAQQELVDVVARFAPRIVKMAPAGEPAED